MDIICCFHQDPYAPKWDGGTEITARLMAKHFSTHGHTVRIATLGKARYVRDEKYAEVRSFTSPFSYRRWLLAQGKASSSTAALIYGHNTAIARWFPWKRYKGPTLLFPVGFPELADLGPFWKMHYRFLLPTMFQEATKIGYLTEHELPVIHARLKDRSKLVWLPSGVEYDYWQNGEPKVHELPWLLSPGGYWPNKHQEIAVRAMALDDAAAASSPSCLLATCGNDPNGQREELKLAKPKNVLLLGHMDDHPYRRLACSAELFIVPSSFEGFGLVFLEALACGVPFLSGSVGIAPFLKDSGAICRVSKDVPPKPSWLYKNAMDLLRRYGETDSAERFWMAEQNKSIAKKYDWNRHTLPPVLATLEEITRR